MKLGLPKKNNFSFKSLRSFNYRIGVNPEADWLLAIAFFVLFTVGLFYLNIQIKSLFLPGNSLDFSDSDMGQKVDFVAEDNLNKVLDFYDKREQNLEDLLQKAPTIVDPLE